MEYPSFVSCVKFIVVLCVYIPQNIYVGFYCLVVSTCTILRLENQLKTGVSFQDGKTFLSVAHANARTPSHGHIL